MKNAFKKLSIFITSRMFYLLLGLFFALAVSVAYAAWDTKVNPGNTLTSTLWNDVVDKLVELDNRGATIDDGDCYEEGFSQTAGAGVMHSCANGYVVVGVASGGYNCDTGCGHLLGNIRCCKLISN